MEQQTGQEDPKVVLDGKEVSRDQLKEEQEKGKKIAERQDGSFVTLQKLRG
jgi:hypothetical protein